MIAVQCCSVDNNDWGYAVELPEVPFPGDEVICGRWGAMRVIRRQFICNDVPEARNGADGLFIGAMLFVRKEGGGIS